MLRRIRERLPCCLSRGLLARHRAAGLRRVRPTDREDVQITEKAPNKGLFSSERSLPPMMTSIHERRSYQQLLTISCVMIMEKSRKEGESLRGGERWLFSSLFLLSPPLSSRAITPGLPLRLVRCRRIYQVSSMSRDIKQVRAALSPLIHHLKHSSSMPRKSRRGSLYARIRAASSERALRPAKPSARL